MKSSLEMGKNRTGIDLSPLDKRALVEGALAAEPSSLGDESALDEERSDYLERPDGIGSMPPPATLKGAAGTLADLTKATNVSVLLDKIGERLAFERTGARLYHALVGKAEIAPPLPSGPTPEDLLEIQEDELRHFGVLREALIELGADPTAMTPSADVAAVSSLGLLQVIGDPRMNLLQSLEAILVAELVDNDAWSMLIDLARSTGHDELAERFEIALLDEREHLARVRTWVGAATLAGAKPAGKA